MSKVVIIKCDSYEYPKVKSSIKKGIELLGGLNKFITKDEKILLKPNLLSPDPPEKCVTTHPSIFKAIGEILIDYGVKVFYGDSPAIANPLKVAEKTGIAEVAMELGIELADFVNGKDIVFEKGIQNKKFHIANGVLESDCLISLPKLKTHGQQKLTCAVKNQFGCVPGVLKGEFHAKLPNVNNFAKMLLDLNRYIKPRLYIMDAVWAMEGNGPRGGSPKKLGLILISDDPIALDATACRIINVNPGLVPSITFGHQFGDGKYFDNEIEILGETIESVTPKRFKIDRSPLKVHRSVGLARLISNLIVQKPVITESKCIKCGLCVQMCPVSPKALYWNDDKHFNTPKYDYDKCIRCFCCQEICPESAIKLKNPLLRKIFKFLSFNKR